MLSFIVSVFSAVGTLIALTVLTFGLLGGSVLFFLTVVSWLYVFFGDEGVPIGERVAAALCITAAFALAVGGVALVLSFEV